MFFTAGQFAKIHNINKRTLHYYDEIGLFSPSHRGDNGYRYYTYQQSPTLEMLLALRELGMSIEEIKNYMESPSVPALKELLAERQEAAAKACGFESGRKTDKSKRVQTHLMAPGLPVLDGAAAAMVCRVRQVVKYEDHTVFFAEIEVAEETEAKPLPYVSGDYFPAG